jgi:hypothetical protein
MADVDLAYELISGRMRRWQTLAAANLQNFSIRMASRLGDVT